MWNPFLEGISLLEPLGPLTTWVHILLKTLDALIIYTMTNNGREKRWHWCQLRFPRRSGNIYDKVPNSVNSKLIEDFHSYMKGNATSERHQNNSLKAVIAFAEFIGYETTFYQISAKEQVTKFLDKKIRSNSDDPERRWITTWNDYLVRIKHFFRWLHNIAVE